VFFASEKNPSGKVGKKQLAVGKLVLQSAFANCLKGNNLRMKSDFLVAMCWVLVAGHSHQIRKQPGSNNSRN
jgi:hypothetical protein